MGKMKFLIRWTIGPVSPEGFNCLAVSINYFKMLWKDRADFVVCYNQLNNSNLNELKKMGVDIYKQKITDFPIKPYFYENSPNCWKLYPPRLRKGSYELIVDNDIVLTKTLPYFEENRILLTEGRERNYGQFDDVISYKTPLNSGIIGLPPNFDFQARLLKFLPDNFKWESYYDEQGLVVASLIDFLPIILPRKYLEFAGPNEVVPNSPGIHFVGLNVTRKHNPWLSFTNKFPLKLLQ